jgi:hypothetical protein
MMWTLKKIDEEIEVGVPLIYLNDGRWWGAYKPTEYMGIVLSIGSKKKAPIVAWGEKLHGEWTEYLSKGGE